MIPGSTAHSCVRSNIVANLLCFASQELQNMVDQGPLTDAQCPTWAASLGYMGVAAAVCLSNWGSAVSRDVYCHKS